MACQSNEEKLITARSMVATIETTLKSLYAKQSNSLSQGDQSLTLASIKELEESRQKWRHEVENLEAAVNGHRKTLKMYFR